MITFDDTTGIYEAWTDDTRPEWLGAFLNREEAMRAWGKHRRRQENEGREDGSAA